MVADKLKKTLCVICSKCGEKGHNFKTCKGAPSNPNWQPKGKRARTVVDLSTAQTKVLVSLTRPLGAGTFVHCSSESPLSLADDVWNVLKEMSQGATKMPSRTRVVLLRKRKGKSVFDWDRLDTPYEEPPLYSKLTSCVPTNPQFRVQLTFGAGVAWSSWLSPRLPKVTRCHRYNFVVTRTSCA
ncbi:hypothetical protein PIB30_043044 [Stylosanthes scabra]|uniref:CCHC-type domain-containing protein n=1 Tax=Stylosanthes scabra TaxID=79078 RepID=A0ABU6ZE57_9FABA|nr:hypothetical protein [Stylosanthes scabra]